MNYLTLVSLVVSAVSAAKDPLDIIHVGGDVGIIHVGDDLMFLGQGSDMRGGNTLNMAKDDPEFAQVGVIHVGEGVIYVGDGSDLVLNDLVINDGDIYVGEDEIKVVGVIHVGLKNKSGKSLRR